MPRQRGDILGPVALLAHKGARLVGCLQINIKPKGRSMLEADA